MPLYRLASAALLLCAATAYSSPNHQSDILRSHIDNSVSPGVDFFSYANGAWLKNHPIPPAEAAWGIGNEVRDELYAKLRKINETSAAKHSAMGSSEQKVGDFWAVGMDTEKAEKLGISPLRPALKKIDAVSSLKDAVDLGFDFQHVGVDSFVGLNISQDEKHSDQMAVHISQDGLGLPERDFYFNKEAGFVKIRGEYVKLLQQFLKLTGTTEGTDSLETRATNLMAFETSLAQISRKLEDLRDPEANYNKMTLETVESKYTPSIPWAAKLAAWHIHPSFAIVGQPDFYGGLEGILKATSVATLRDYYRCHLLASYAPYLNKEAGDLSFHFYHQVLSGQKQQQPRWKRVLASEDGPIGFVLGRVFVKDYFPPVAKKRYSNLVEAIRSAYHDRINRLDWMSPETKAKAHRKLDAVRKKVGFPDHWKDYSALKISRNSYCENAMAIAQWGFNDQLSKYGKPVDRTEWGMTPQTYNAYYDPSNNEIVLPAACFAIPGLPDSKIDDALMYGYAGASTIGHEMTHGFDDEGRQFDLKGNLANWWTKEDAVKFQHRADLMIKEFNAYEPLPGLHINGKASLGENIADYGGLLLGLDAFKKTETYKRGRKIAGLSPVQRYFLGYALSWLDQQRTESLRRELASDVHAPAKYRVLGPLSNMPDFYKAFNIKPGQPMWRPEEGRVHIW